MFSLSFLFLTLPLYFSHIFMHFGVVMGDGASFERQKMYLFIVTVLIALAEMILMRYDGFVAQVRRYGLMIIGFILLPLIPTLLYGGEFDVYWIRGSYEKFHGYLLYVGIIILGFCISLLSQSEKLKVIKLSMIPVALVSMIAILEGLSIQVFFPPSAGAWGEGVRAISTLGNPNYLAGYLLLMLPLVGYIRTPERYIVGLLILGALLATGSYIGIAIGFVYVLYLSLNWGFSFLSFRSKTEAIAHPGGVNLPSSPLIRKKESISLKMNLKGIPTGGQKRTELTLGITFFVGFLAVVFGYFLIPTDKLLSLSGRFVLMREVFIEMIRFPFSLVTGYGPEAILRFFSESRSSIVDSYFPRGSLIDSSHNILIDFAFQYGILPLTLLIAMIYRNWNTWNPHARVSWILGIVFLMFNPYVVIHLTFLTLTLSLHDDRK